MHSWNLAAAAIIGLLSTSTLAQQSPSSTTTSSSGPGPTLISPYLWIRAVAAPNYHKYLQSAPLLSPGPATLSNSTTAGQFSITAAGQLVQLISAPDASEEQLLYAHVAGATTHGGQSLAVSFAADEGAYGTWAFSGDALTWTAANVSRPNLSAWYVCEGQAVYVNLGAYLYNTPDGCADQTVSFFLSFPPSLSFPFLLSFCL